MIYSMTGFAVQKREVGHIRVHLELRSVNSRYLDLVFRVGDELRAAEPLVRDFLSSRLVRGKVECRVSLQSDGGTSRGISVDSGLLEQLRAAEAQVKTSMPAAASLSVGEVLRWPGILGEDRVGFDELRPAVLGLAAAACEELLATRAREGEKLAATIRERVARMRELVAQAKPRVPALVREYQERLAARLRDAVAALDEERIRQEVAVFAQRIDVDEEFDRLVAHLGEVERILHDGGQAGKRLDFLMQELNREANTLASKSVASDLSGIAMEMKVLIEQMREQVQNIE